MKSKVKIVASIFMLVLVQLFSASVQAQTWSFDTYGCLSGGSRKAEVNKKSVAVKTNNDALNKAMVEDIVALQTVFEVKIPVYFILDDDERKANGFFAPVKIDELIREDGENPDNWKDMTGSVFLNSGLLIKEWKETNGSLMSVPAILAHEFGHGMQSDNKFPYDGKWREMHADYLAGWFIGHRGRFRPQNAVQAILNFYNKGDYDFNDKGHHGTPEERAKAFAAGYTLNVQGNVASGTTAYNSGLQYVKDLGAR